MNISEAKEIVKHLIGLSKGPGTVLNFGEHEALNILLKSHDELESQAKMGNIPYKEAIAIKQENEELKVRCAEWVKATNKLMKQDAKIEQLKKPHDKLEKGKAELQMQLTSCALAKTLIPADYYELQKENEQLKSQYTHDVHCNADRRKPIGCEMCSCFIYKELKQLKSQLKQETHAKEEALKWYEDACKQIATLQEENAACRALGRLIAARLDTPKQEVDENGLWPCPFCGNTELKTGGKHTNKDLKFNIYSVMTFFPYQGCEMCINGFDIKAETELEAIKAWNTREGKE